MQKTQAKLEVYVPERDFFTIEEIKEFSYTYDVLNVGDQCTFTVVASPDGAMLERLAEGSSVKCYLRNRAVNGNAWTLKHSGIIVAREADALAGTIKVTVADLGWHLLRSSAPLRFKLRGVPLVRLLDPDARVKSEKERFLDPSFGFRGPPRTGLDANALNRALKQGKRGLIPPGQSPRAPIPVIQVEPGETYFDVMSRYAMRENQLIGVSVDGYIQAWNPNYERAAAYSVRMLATPAQRQLGAAIDDALLAVGMGNPYAGQLGGENNVKNVVRRDDINTRYTDVTCVGEIVVNPRDLRGNQPSGFNPNANKTLGWYVAAPGMLPFRHSKTASDGEMFDRAMARQQAEWMWKRAMFDSHHLEATFVDHYQEGPQGAAWLEADEMVDVNVPMLRAVGPYYAAQVTCTSTESGGDVTTMILRWPHLLSASFGEWRNPPQYSGVTPKALTPGKGGSQ